MSELRRLQFLLELERHGTIAAVAAATSYSTSGISQQLTALERDVGVALFEPAGRRIRLTAAGIAMARHASTVLAAWEVARSDALQTAASVTGEFHLGVFQTAYLALVPPLIDTLAVSHPGVELQVSQVEPTEAVAGLLARELDAAIVERYPGARAPLSKEFVIHDLGRDPMLLALPPSLAGDTPALSHLSRQLWAFEPAGSRTRIWADNLCRDAGFEPLVRYETADVLMQLELVRQDRAAAFIPTLTPTRFTQGVTTRALNGQERVLELLARSSSSGNPLLELVRSALSRAHQEGG